MNKDLYSILNSDGELIGKYWAHRPCVAGKKALKQIFRDSGKHKNVIFEIYNRMKKKLYKYRGNVKMNSPNIKFVDSNLPINVFYSYIIKKM